MKPIEWKDAFDISWIWKPTHVNVVITSVEGVDFDKERLQATDTFVRFHLDSVKDHFLRTNPKEIKKDTWTIAEIEIPEEGQKEKREKTFFEELFSKEKEHNLIVSLITKHKNEDKKWYKCREKDFIEKGGYYLSAYTFYLYLNTL